MRDQKIRETETKRREEKERADARLNEREGPTSLPSSFSLAPHTQKCLACGSQQPRRRRRGEVLTFLSERGILLFARMEYNEKAQTHDARLLWWRGGEGEGDCDRSFVAKWGEATTSLLFVRVDDGQICCAEHGRQRSSSSSSDGLCNGSSGVHLIILSPFRKKTVEGGKEEEEDG